jgi:hypothetical protein
VGGRVAFEHEHSARFRERKRMASGVTARSTQKASPVGHGQGKEIDTDMDPPAP